MVNRFTDPVQLRLRRWYRLALAALAAVLLVFAAAQALWQWKPDEPLASLFGLFFVSVAAPMIWRRKELYAASKGDEAAIKAVTGSKWSIVERVGD